MVFEWLICRIGKHPLKTSLAVDSFYLVWLWIPTTIYTMQDVDFHNRKYLEPAYKAWWCWALRREGFYIGVRHEPISRLDELRRLGVIED